MSALAADPAAHGVRWTLDALFRSIDDPKIDATWAEAHRRADEFAAAYRGKVESGSLSAEALAAVIREFEDLSTEASKPELYANLVFAADTGDPKIGAFLQAQMEKASEVRVKLMFFGLELQAAEDGYIESVLADPAMAEYRHFVQTQRAFSPHKLSETEEVLLEETANTGNRAWVRLHEELTSNHVYRFTDPASGETRELSQEQVLDLLRDPDRATRQAAADAFSAGLGEMQRTIVYLYNTLLADKRLEDRLRRFEHPESRRHLDNELDKATVDTVMRLCKERGDIVARYYKVKREALGLPELTHIDRYAPLFETKERVGWEQARQIVLDSFAGFSAEMADRAREFFDNGWIDAEPRPGKGGGAFCSYNTPDTHPVLFQSYLGGMDDVMTLAHEMGHGVHASLSRAQRPVNFHGTLPLAELASIFGEMMTFERLVASASLDDKLALYAEKIEGMFATVHRQAAMFRFEQRCHQKRRTDGELSAEDFGAIWQEELQSMFGDGLKLGEQHRAWWMYVGHFVFAPFYVYAYSFGELLALGVYEKAKREGPAFVEKYVDVLKRGGSEAPVELMARLGIDLGSEEFWRGGFATLERLVGEFEALWAERNARG
jgi:oligoendopeptidase F